MRLIKFLSTHVAKGGKTATTLPPEGTRDKDADNVAMPPSPGEPPPPRVPGCAEPPTACPLIWKFIPPDIIMVIIIPDIPAAATPAAAITAASAEDGVV